MADQDSPWKGLPPAPPGVPDQSPKPSGTPPAQRPGDDPWARPPGWPPSTGGSRSGAGAAVAGAPMLVKVVLGLAAFMVLSTCVGMLPSFVPNNGGDGEGPAKPIPVPGTSDTPSVERPFRVVRDGPAPGAPAGWFRYVAGDGTFSLLGPGRPDTDVSRRTGRYTFDAAPLTLTAEVASARGSGRPARSRLERAIAIFLDELGAVEQRRRWSGFGDDVVLDVDARRGEDKLRIRTFSDRRRIFRAYALWAGALTADEEVKVETFLAGLESDGHGQ